MRAPDVTKTARWRRAGLAALTLLLALPAAGQVPADTVAVQVVREGRPVPGAQVRLVGEPPGGGEVGLGEQATGADGVARFPVPHRPGLFVVAHTSWQGVTYTSPKRSFDPDPARGLELAIEVFDRDGADVADLTLGAASHLVIQFEEGALDVTAFLTVRNPTRKTVAPEGGLTFPLPEGFREVTGAGGNPVETVAGVGASVPGPFLPGNNEVRMRFTLPLDGKRLEYRQRLPVAGRTIQVVVDEAPGLTVGGPLVQGQQVRENEGIRFRVVALATPEGAVAFTLDGLPYRSTRGRWIALTLAGGVVMLGLVASVVPGRGSPSERLRRAAEQERDALLADLEELEREHLEGRIDPASWGEDREALLERLASVLRRLEG